MKRIFVILLALVLAILLAFAAVACSGGGGGSRGVPDGDAAAMASPSPAPPTVSASPTPTPTPELPFPGKIAIVTNDVTCSEEEYRSADYIIKKYGEDKFIHRVWPVRFSEEGELMINILQDIAEDPDVKALVINQAVINSNIAVDKMLEARPDIFVVYCHPAEWPHEVVRRAHLSLNSNYPLRGETIVMQAKAMGAKTFAHYSFPRHMDVPTLSMRRDLMKEACEREGIRFVDLDAPDPMRLDAGIPGAQQFILEDVPRQVAELGRDTAFFSTNCAMQIPLVIKIVDEGAIYPEPCCPSPYHAFPSALGISDKVWEGLDMHTGEDGELVDVGRLRTHSDLLVEIRSVIASKGASGRLATWPAPTSIAFTAVGVEYAIKWINGEVPKEKGVVDYAAIEEIYKDYIYEITGEVLGIEINPLSLNGRIYESYLMVLPDSIVF